MICRVAAIASLCAAAGGMTAAQTENEAQARTREAYPSQRDLSDPAQRTLYAVGYAHLDTQWRWDFPITIDRYIRDTLEQNFARFEAFPDYTFSFTGSLRYEMIEEYYPEHWDTLKKYVDDGRWFVSGSSVDEGDVNVPSAESIIRQVLYGNKYFRDKFGKESVDFMLPDCFGFPASMPTIWAHCGLLGFSTQKLTWGSAVGIPFPVGVWEGPDGSGVIAALDPGAYVGAVEGRVDLNEAWAERVRDNGEMFGVYADYHYYGVGDQGGAPREKDVRNYTESIDNPDSLFHLSLAASDEMYKDITPDQVARLPRYKGDMLLTEHSAGTLTSQSYMKRWNRKGEQLADAAERAAVAAHLLGGLEYPRHTLERAWVRLLANQMHDILPGTSIPIAYNWSWNDEVIALNQFAKVLTESVGAWATGLDTDVEGTPLVVYNPLARERTGLIEATVPGAGAPFVRVFDPDGNEVPSQLIERGGDSLRVLFRATAPSVGLAVYEVRPANTPYESSSGGAGASREGLRGAAIDVSINGDGDIEQVRVDGRGLLAAPHRLVLTHESPKHYPAWNMDWDDRQREPVGTVGGPARVTVLERGPLRASVRVSREAFGSSFDQVISVTDGAGEDDGFVRIDSLIDWQTSGVALKAAFPLAASNPNALYNWGVGTIERGNNNPKKYEVPSHEWFSLTDSSGDFGATILEDSKFGSDKPSDNEVRLTLLYSPEVSSSYQDQHSQDWGLHEMSYAISASTDPVRSDEQGRHFNQPMRVFVAPRHAGPLGRRSSLVSLSGDAPVALRALKLAEESDRIIARVHELAGEQPQRFGMSVLGGVRSAARVDGQERVLGTAPVSDRQLRGEVIPFGISTYALETSARTRPLNPVPAQPVERLPFDVDVMSFDSDRTDGAIDRAGRTLPAEMLPESIVSGGVVFRTGPAGDGEVNAVECRGQTIELPAGTRAVHLLVAADSQDDVRARFRTGLDVHERTVQPWTGFVGQWDDRVWASPPPEIFFSWDGRVADIVPGYIRRDPIAWFATHRHHPENGNESYRFSYLFHEIIEAENGCSSVTLPNDPRVKVFALSVSDQAPGSLSPAAPLYDHFDEDRHVEFRYQYPPEPDPVYAGLEPGSRVLAERADAVEGLALARPSDADSAQGLRFTAQDHAGDLPPHPGSGMEDGGWLPRLNDGEPAMNNDDTRRCVWFDQEGRFSVDLGAPREIFRIDTFSWHVSNRAPQHFSVWGAPTREQPGALFDQGGHGDWELIGVVDTRELGDGGVHASSVLPEGTPSLGRYRHLLWVAENMGQGTFFFEIDVHEAE